MSGTFHDHRWHGPPEAVTAALDAITPESTIPPRVLDGIAYVAVRALAPIALPAGLAETGPELSIAILGTWADE